MDRAVSRTPQFITNDYVPGEQILRACNRKTKTSYNKSRSCNTPVKGNHQFPFLTSGPTIKQVLQFPMTTPALFPWNPWEKGNQEKKKKHQPPTHYTDSTVRTHQRWSSGLLSQELHPLHRSPRPTLSSAPLVQYLPFPSAPSLCGTHTSCCQSPARIIHLHVQPWMRLAS